MRVASIAQLRTLLQDPNGLVVDHCSTHVARLVEIATHVQENLRRTMECEFKLKFDGQDRTDFAQIEIPPSMLKSPADRWVEIRLSNKVPLVAINDESKVSEPFLHAIKDALEKAGCIVVNQSIFFPAAGKTSVAMNRDPAPDALWYSLFDYD